MTRMQLQDLKVGDICIFKSGYDKGTKCEVVYIEDNIDGCDSILVRALSGQEFDIRARNGNRWLKLISAKCLDVTEQKTES